MTAQFCRIENEIFGGSWLDDHCDPSIAPDHHPRPSFDELVDDLEIPVEARRDLEDWVEREIKAKGRAEAAEAVGRILAAINQVSPTGAAIVSELGLSDESISGIARRFRTSKQNCSQLKQTLQRRSFASGLYHKPPDEDGSRNWVLFRELSAAFNLPGDLIVHLRKEGMIPVVTGPDEREVWCDKAQVAGILEGIMQTDPDLILKWRRSNKKEKAPTVQPQPQPQPQPLTAA